MKALFSSKKIIFLLFLLFSASSVTAQINSKMANDLAKQNGCIACHHAKRKLVGPAYQNISKRYSADSQAEKTLMDSVKLGVRGKYGFVPMPPHPRLSDVDNRILIKWILQGAPE